MFNFNHLYYFYITAKSEGVGPAAKRLRISQPSLSSQLKVLERAMDARLFYRVGRRNHLTQAGLLIYGFCRRMFEISEEMTELLSESLPSSARRIQIGVSDEVDRSFVVEIISTFLRKHGMEQRPKVTVVSGSHELLAERLKFRELDAIVSPIGDADPDLKNIIRAEVPVVLLCPSHWKTRKKPKESAPVSQISGEDDGADVQWVKPSARFKLRAEIDRFFEKYQLKGRTVLESDVIMSLVRSVVDEVGLTFLPLIYVAREVREKSVRVFGPPGGYWKYRLWLTSHMQNGNDPLVQSLARAFKEISLRSSPFARIGRR